MGPDHPKSGALGNDLVKRVFGLAFPIVLRKLLGFVFFGVVGVRDPTFFFYLDLDLDLDLDN